MFVHTARAELQLWMHKWGGFSRHGILFARFWRFNVEFWYFQTFHFYERSVSEWCLKYLLDLRKFVAEELPDNSTLLAEICSSRHLTGSVFCDLLYFILISGFCGFLKCGMSGNAVYAPLKIYWNKCSKIPFVFAFAQGYKRINFLTTESTTLKCPTRLYWAINETNSSTSPSSLSKIRPPLTSRSSPCAGDTAQNKLDALCTHDFQLSRRGIHNY
jgi:hypothetical protein